MYSCEISFTLAELSVGAYVTSAYLSRFSLMEPLSELIKPRHEFSYRVFSHRVLVLIGEPFHWCTETRFEPKRVTRG